MPYFVLMPFYCPQTCSIDVWTFVRLVSKCVHFPNKCVYFVKTTIKQHANHHTEVAVFCKNIASVLQIAHLMKERI